MLRLMSGVANSSGTENVPNYYVSPQEAAAQTWGDIDTRLQNAPEVWPYLPYIYLLATNEPRTKRDPAQPNWGNMHPVDWLGWYEYYLARLVTENTAAKFLAFGMNAGEPEPEDLHHLGMLKYLEFCHEQGGRVGIALHEGMNDGFGLDYRTDPPLAWHPFLVGRFEAIFDLVDWRRWNRPPVVITEWAWNYQDMAEQDKAMGDVDELARYLAQFTAVRGCTLWALVDEERGPLSHKMQAMIQPVTDYNLTARFPDPSPPIEPPPVPDERTKAQRQWDASLEEQTERGIWLNPEAGLQAAIRADGFWPVHREIPAEGEPIMAAEHPVTGARRLYVWDGRARWMGNPYEDAPPPPPPPPGGENVDLRRYFEVVTDGVGPFCVLQHMDGRTEDLQVQVDDGIAYLVKNSQYEEIRVSDGYVWRRVDTSPGDGKFYRLNDEGLDWSKWCPSLWRPGMVYERNPVVRWYNKNDCQMIRPPETARSWLRFAAVHETWRSRAGIEFADVIELHWLVSGPQGSPAEWYWFAPGVGLVAWRNTTGMESWIVEMPGGRAPLRREVIGCLG
ncbi:MAG: hypothetical protein ACE5EY_14870 [Anaerolineae bacterium]